MNLKLILFFFCLIYITGDISSSPTQASLPYKNPKLPIEDRVKDLLSQMTIEEKVGQLLCPMGWEMYDKEENGVVPSDKFEQLVKEQHVGMFWATFRADPWTKKTLDNGLNPYLAAETANALQRYVMENTRLGIPLFFAEEAPHGHMAIGTTVFPTGIGQASTWNPSLLEKMGKAIAVEVRAQGAHIAYGPVLDLALDPRWSRVEETLGEDPVLTAVLGAAICKGAGGGDLSQSTQVISTLKHFIAYGSSEGGHNGNSVQAGKRAIYEKHLPPFRSAIEAGALSVMSAYNSIDGVPSTANKELFSDLLLEQWGFRGFSVSDLFSIDGLHGNHRVAENITDAAVLAIQSGISVDLGAAAYPHLVTAVKQGRIAPAVIDSAVCRVLRLKFKMGLFENPYVNSHKAAKAVRSPEHVALALEVARESIVLLENKSGLLPLNKESRLAVIGPNADNVYNMLGDYTAPQEAGNVTTVLQGILSKIGGPRVDYVKGCAIRDTTLLQIEEAVAAAKKADMVVAVVGGSSARDFKTKYVDTGAAVVDEQLVSDMESGEGFDRSTLDLMGKQLDLLKALKVTGKPLVVVYIQGRPLDMTWAKENADALITAWYPGQEGGNAIADVLFGDYNPAGRLPISIPRSVGQLPVYYNRANPWGHDYVETSSKPLYSFGHGLSFSRFQYQNLSVKQTGITDFEISFSIKNIGQFDGDEVAQLYIRDDFATFVQPVKQLKHFKRVFLRKGEETSLTFHLDEKDFALLNADMEMCVESGQFTLMVGASADDIHLTEKIWVDKGNNARIIK